MKPILSIVISILLLASAACAMDFSNMPKYVNVYNSKIVSASPIIKDLVGNENVDFTIALKNGSSVRWGMEMENAVIVRSGYGGLKNPTIVVYATEDAINKVLAASDPIGAYKAAEGSGQIRVDCRTITSKIKVTTALSAGEVIKPFLGLLKAG
ncbi:MAG: hypothetical protein ACE14P_02035 [Methanotrichaceae archaeon]